MRSGVGERTAWVYYGAIALFVGILAFAVLGLVRSSSVVGAASGRSASPGLQPSKGPAPGSILSAGPPPTIQIPPPTASAATPSRTYIHPPPEREAFYSDPAAGTRR